MKKALIAIAIAAYASTATALIENSLHDLSGGYDPGSGLVAANFSSCQFCHAPHYGNTTGDYGQIPLWNRVTPSAATQATYSLYTATADATVVLGAGSFTCLSCHDGTSDMGQSFTGVTNGFASSPTQMADNSHNLAGTYDGSAYVPNNANVDLRDDHPVGVNYVGGAGTDYKAVAVVTAGGADALKLYGTAGSETVECGSCHDPHKTTYGPFLRKAQNLLCSTCHAK